MEKLNEQKKIILEDFDFNRVERIIEPLKLEWTYISGEVFTPTIKDLKLVAELCLDNAINSTDNEECIFIGGFEALKINGVLELRFILEKCNPLKNILNNSKKM